MKIPSDYPSPAEQACEVPLVEQLRSVPPEARVVIVNNESGNQGSHSIPYGSLCYRAADEIERLQQVLFDIATRPGGSMAVAVAQGLSEGTLLRAQNGRLSNQVQELQVQLGKERDAAMQADREVNMQRAEMNRLRNENAHLRDLLDATKIPAVAEGAGSQPSWITAEIARLNQVAAISAFPGENQVPAKPPSQSDLAQQLTDDVRQALKAKPAIGSRIDELSQQIKKHELLRQAKSIFPEPMRAMERKDGGVCIECGNPAGPRYYAFHVYCSLEQAQFIVEACTRLMEKP